MSRLWTKPNRNLPGAGSYRITKFSKNAVAQACKTPIAHAYLEAVKGSIVASAHYQQFQDGHWHIVSCDPTIHFLRFCGPENAPIALQKRGFSYSWPVREHSKTLKRLTLNHNPSVMERDRSRPKSPSRLPNRTSLDNSVDNREHAPDLATPGSSQPVALAPVNANPAP